MTDTLSWDRWGQSGILPWPPRKFREELAHSLCSFILDKGVQSLDPDSDISSDTRESFAACLHQYIREYMNAPPEYGAMCHRYWVQDSNDDPYTPIGASHVTNNSTAYSPQDSSIAGDSREQVDELYGPFNQNHLFATTRGIYVAQQIKGAERAFEASNSPLCPDELPRAGSGNRAAGGGATSIGTHFEPTLKRRNREATPLDENSSTVTVGSRPSKRADTRTVDKSEFRHVCICGKRFQFPARLKSHMETASHRGRGYRCEKCNSEFTRQSSLMRHQGGNTACKGVRRVNGTSTLGSSSGVRSVFHASAKSPSRTSYNAQSAIPLSDSSTDPVRTPVPNFLPSSSTNSRTTSKRNYSTHTAHAPSQPQDVRITQSQLSPEHKFIDPIMLGAPLYHRMTDISHAEEYLALASGPS